MKVLVAEDEPISRRLVRVTLEKSGLEVQEVADGTEAWQRLQGEDLPAVVILDWMMPGLSGIEVCRKVRERLDAVAPHLILVTSMDHPEDLIAGIEAGADDYLTKPFNPAELYARVHAGIRLMSLQRALADRVRELQEALAQVKQLRRLLPICAWCKKIRNDQDYWQSVESYVEEHSGTTFTHGICPGCTEKLRDPMLGAGKGRA